jgi:hypothetical protein
MFIKYGDYYRNYKDSIGKHYDLIHPIKLIITGNMDHLDYLKNMIFKHPIKKYVEIGGSGKLAIIDLLLNTNVITQTSEKIVIDISHLPYFSQEFYGYSFIIEYGDEIPDLNIEMITEMIVIDDCKIRESIRDCSKQLVRYNNHYKSYDKTDDYDIKLHMHMCGTVKGLYINCNHIDLENITLKLNDYTFIDYDKTMINNLCIVINENMIYLPFDMEHSYKTFNYESFNSAITISRIHTAYINIKFNKVQEHIYIYSDSFNVLTIIKSIEISDLSEHEKKIYELLDMSTTFDNNHGCVGFMMTMN